MTTTITIDAAGRFVLPKSMRDRLQLRGGSRMKAELIAKKIELSPEPGPDVRIMRKGKRLVLAGGAPFDAVAAIKADREAGEEMLAGRALQTPAIPRSSIRSGQA